MNNKFAAVHIIIHEIQVGPQFEMRYLSPTNPGDALPLYYSDIFTFISHWQGHPSARPDSPILFQTIGAPN